eukprot:2483711-Ditylum_brightwellii.AAC.1
MVTFLKTLTAFKLQGNGPQELKSIILIECPQVRELTKGNYHMYKLIMMPYNANSPMYNLAVPFDNNKTVEKWLKFCQNLQTVITGQNITNPQGMHVTTKSMLHGDTLTAFKNVERVNRPQSKLANKKTMEDTHMHMFPLQAYITQTRYMCYDRTPQVKLAEDKLMDILENAVPKSWQGEFAYAEV